VLPFIPQFTVELDDALSLAWSFSPDRTRITVEATLTKRAWCVCGRVMAHGVPNALSSCPFSCAGCARLCL
jgi:hypothetical protein